MPPRVTHWADAFAAEVIRKWGRDKEQVVATGITPSGPIHVGNVREVVTADAIRRALAAQGARARLVYIADTFDPLRRVYPFLPESYSEYVGRPLCDIPDPAGDGHESYAEHFLAPFVEALPSLGIEAEVVKAHERYRAGSFQEEITSALAGADGIRDILRDVSGREVAEDWAPLQPVCESCGRMTTTRLTAVDSAKTRVDYVCGECGKEGTADYSKGGAKLPWRIDWPARWKVFGVTVEPFGKDHAAAGGSFDTGQIVSGKVFQAQPPLGLAYEWINLRGQGAMASSTGVAVSVSDLMEVVPPEIVRFLIVRVKPERHIEFDSGTGLVQLINDYHELERQYYDGAADGLGRRIYELSQVSGRAPAERPVQVPFGHLVVALQTAARDEDATVEVLRRSGYALGSADREHIMPWIARAARWLDKYAPDAYRFSLQTELPAAAQQLSSDQKALLAALAERLAGTEWNAEALHEAIHETGSSLGLSAKASFQAVYLPLLGKAAGPRAGWFLASLDRDLVAERFRRAAEI